MTQALEFKAAVSADDAGEITGLAWPFGTPDRVGDMIEKGAFADAALPVPMLFGHNPNDPVGVWTHVQETAEGLAVKGRLLVDDVPRAREVRALVAAGTLGGLSIGFSTKKAAPRVSNGRTVGRTISSLELVEISLVTIPAHPGARVTSAKNAARAFALADLLNRAAARL
ncbi:HK97 family phage prohead protease [Aureimonas leprariae]|uniref:HK97 family phage prohead protease n=1 Tax=Plantimonas leprariae TaxID=2615207 RepID=A0A7V7PNW0_9HYPH|nr:HK97 family phage prohead protease [Aureimonas leprariae]KAB0679517.1 HK97 family phage prohead protease [Aureimonas leprariae]